MVSKGSLLQQLTRYDEAMKCYDKSLEINPNDVECWKFKGILLEQLRQYENAIICYDNFLKEFPNNANILIKKGVAYIDSKKFEVALNIFDLVISSNPYNVEAISNKGICLAKLKKYNEAINQFKTITDLKTNLNIPQKIKDLRDEDDFGGLLIKLVKKYLHDDWNKTEKDPSRFETPWEKLRILEKELRLLIRKELSSRDRDWWKTKIPPDVRYEADIKFKKNTDENLHQIDFINFPDYLKIILRRDNWTNTFKSIFKDETLILAKLKELGSIRNDLAHQRDITEQESSKVILYVDDILLFIKQKI